MQVRVDVARKGGAFRAASLAEDLLAADREEVEVRQPKRGHDSQPEHSRDDRAGTEPGVPRPEADRDQGLTDRNDHDQPVTLDEVRGLHAPAARAAEERPEQADRERGQPERRPKSAVDETRAKDQSRAGEGYRSNPQDRRQQLAVAARSKRVQRELHDVHDQEGNAEDDAVTP